MTVRHLSAGVKTQNTKKLAKVQARLFFRKVRDKDQLEAGVMYRIITSDTKEL